MILGLLKTIFFKFPLDVVFFLLTLLVFPVLVLGLSFLPILGVLTGIMNLNRPLYEANLERLFKSFFFQGVNAHFGKFQARMSKEFTVISLVIILGFFTFGFLSLLIPCVTNTIETLTNTRLKNPIRCGIGWIYLIVFMFFSFYIFDVAIIYYTLTFIHLGDTLEIYLTPIIEELMKHDHYIQEGISLVNSKVMNIFTNNEDFPMFPQKLIILSSAFCLFSIIILYIFKLFQTKRNIGPFVALLGSIWGVFWYVLNFFRSLVDHPPTQKKKKKKKKKGKKKKKKMKKK